MMENIDMMSEKDRNIARKIASSTWKTFPHLGHFNSFIVK